MNAAITKSLEAVARCPQYRFPQKGAGFEAHKELLPMQPGDVPVTYADTADLECDFGFKPKTCLRDGLRKFAVWYKEYYKIR